VLVAANRHPSFGAPADVCAYRATDAALLTDFFCASVRGVASRDYTLAQTRAWALG